MKWEVNKQTAHPWHGVHFGNESPKVVNAIIEIPKGSKGKYEVDKESGLIMLDRLLYTSVHYPTNYGFIPRTYAGDKDPLDILVISQIEMPHLCLVESKVIGVMRMKDLDEVDDKIIAVALNDVAVNHMNTLDDLPPHTMKEICRFFEDYKILENRKVEVLDCLGVKDAYEIINESIYSYHEKFK